MMNEQELIAEKENHEEWFSTIKGFAGSGIAVDDAAQLCIKIFTHNMTDEDKEQIRDRVNAAVIFEESGEFNALS